jgi:ribosome-associated toxin RatA of RatAB toxin-antitoxin module
MYTIERSAMVLHSAEKMFELVNDVESYSEFLPWCGGSHELSRTQSEVVASVTIAYKGIRKSFTTRNELVGNSKTKLSLVEGPFSALAGSWSFVPIGNDSSRIVLKLEFDFANKLVGKVVGPIFRGIADSMVDSFCSRADQIYGDGSGKN